MRAALLTSPLCFDFHRNYIPSLEWEYHPWISTILAEGTPAHHLPWWWMGVPWVQPKIPAGSKKVWDKGRVATLLPFAEDPSS